MAGQPSKYKEEYCQQLIEHMAKGFSFDAFAGLVRVSRTTLYNWVKEHPEFAEAKEIATGCCLLHWEKLAIDGIFGLHDLNADGKTVIRPLNTGVWALNMRNRFGWRDKIEVTSTEGVKPQRLVIELGSTDEEAAS